MVLYFLGVALHYALDLWFEKVVKRRCRGEACLIRYADDFVCAFENREDAERFYQELGQRLGKFGLELSAEKTRVIPFFGLRVSLGEGSFGERPSRTPDLAEEVTELPEAFHRMVQEEPTSESESAVCATECQTPWILQLLRGKR